jgi:hypothetical protein
MQVRTEIHLTPVRTLLAAVIALAVLALAGLLGYSVSVYNPGHASAGPGQSVVQPGSQAPGSAYQGSSFPYGPGDRAGG